MEQNLINKSKIRIVTVPYNVRIQVLEDMVSNGIDLNHVKAKATYIYNNEKYKVGMWLTNAKKGLNSQRFLNDLKRLGFNTDTKEYLSTEFKFKVLNDMIENGIDINSIKQKDIYHYEGKNYTVGRWLDTAKNGNSSVEFILKLKAIGFNFDKKKGGRPSKNREEMIEY